MTEKIYKKQCKHCGRDFEAKRKDKAHCSNSCRAMEAKGKKESKKETEIAAILSTKAEEVTQNASATAQEKQAEQDFIGEEIGKIWHNRTVLEYVFKNGMKTIHKDALASAGYDLSYMSRQAIKGGKHYTYCFDFGLTNTEKQGIFEIVKK